MAWMTMSGSGLLMGQREIVNVCPGIKHADFSIACLIAFGLTAWDAKTGAPVGAF